MVKIYGHMPSRRSLTGRPSSRRCGRSRRRQQSRRRRRRRSAARRQRIAARRRRQLLQLRKRRRRRQPRRPRLRRRRARRIRAGVAVRVGPPRSGSGRRPTTQPKPLLEARRPAVLRRRRCAASAAGTSRADGVRGRPALGAATPRRAARGASSAGADAPRPKAVSARAASEVESPRSPTQKHHRSRLLGLPSDRASR